MILPPQNKNLGTGFYAWGPLHYHHIAIHYHINIGNI